MTEIRARYGRRRFRVTARGHATPSPAACSGVSALLYALAGFLANAPAGLRAEQVRLAPGEAELVFTGGAAARAVMDMTVIGLAQIAKAAPESVRVAVEDGEAKKTFRVGCANPGKAGVG